MNIFCIPSWYPSKLNPIHGTFVKEQLELMARENPNMTIGVSLWGQGQDPFLIYSSQPIRSFNKLLGKHTPSSYVENEISTYFSPAFTWTRKILNGNLKGIIEANRLNLERFIAEHGKPDVIHAQASYPAAWVSNYLKKKYKIPYIVTLRMSPFPFSQFIRKGQLDASLYNMLHEAATLIATSHSLATRVNGLGLSNCEVVNNPVDMTFFKRSTRKRKAGKRLLTVGRLEDQKGYDLLIKAMASLPLAIKLDIIGDGSLRYKLGDQIKQLGLEDRVVLLGEKSRKEVSLAMSNADGYILSSRHETFGNVLLEAMASGLPMIATRCGGPEEIVSSNVGLLCDVSSVEALVEGVNLFFRKEWDSRLIRKEAEKRFSPSTFTERMKIVYESACGSFQW